MAYKSELSFEGKKIKYKLNSYIQENLFKEKDEYKPRTLEKAAIHVVVKLYVMAVVIVKIVKDSK